jgi:tetratricopeptide (TPR) repeat protein
MHHAAGRQGFRCGEMIRTFLFKTLILAVAVSCAAAAEVTKVSAQKRKEFETEAAKLVADSLRLRATGETDESRRLLHQAVELLPDYAPAHWQLGEIRHGDRWSSLRDVVQSGALNDILAKYHRQRDALIAAALPIWLSGSNASDGQTQSPAYSRLPPTSVRYLRKTLTLQGRPEWAQLHIQVQGKCEVSVNGRAVFHSEGIALRGAKSVAAQLHAGGNVIALSVQGVNNQQAAAIRVWLEGMDRDHAIFAAVTDETWKVSTSEWDNWKEADFDDGKWEATVPTPLAVVVPEAAVAEEWPVSTRLETGLATWCRTQGLVEQARFHWARILRVQPENSEAMKALGLKLYDGHLLTKSQIDDLKQKERAANQAMTRWYPVLQTLYSDLQQDNEKGVTTTAKKLASADAAAIPAFDRALAELPDKDGAPAFVTAFLKSVLAKCDEPEATAKLSQIALQHADPSVRRLAIEALKGRDLLVFVPDLMGALQSPLEVTTSVSTDAKSAICTAKYFKAGINFDEERTETVHFQTEKKGEVSDKERRAATNEQQRIKQRVAAQNAQIPERNERIFAILEAVSPTNPGSTAAAWWKWWGDYNELLIPTQNRVRQSTAEYTVVFDQEHRRRDELGKYRHKDCFAKGTPVWTQAGLKPIESIRVGDTVLAQDVETGEVCFKVVLGTSIRPASPMTSLRVGDETIVSTRGHRYWVDGTGWRMAKNLKAGDALHGFQQRFVIEEANDSLDQQAWNLIVEGFHSYFVGNLGILVHDSGAPRPTMALVPGFPK